MDERKGGGDGGGGGGVCLMATQSTLMEKLDRRNHAWFAYEICILLTLLEREIIEMTLDT